MFRKTVLFSLLSLILIVSATGLECMIYVSSSSNGQIMHLTSMVSCQMHNLPLLDVIGAKPPTDERAGSVSVCLPMFVTCNRDKCGRK